MCSSRRKWNGSLGKGLEQLAMQGLRRSEVDAYVVACALAESYAMMGAAHWNRSTTLRTLRAASRRTTEHDRHHP